MRRSAVTAAQPQDQAHGLRRMFAATRQAFVPLAHNPYAAYGGIAMERLCSAFGERCLRTLVVDASDTASTPHEVSRVDLSACIEPLSASVSFLAARGLPMRWLDSRGSTSGFLVALAQAAPAADVVLVHAGASDLCRLFAGRTPRPILLGSEKPEGLTHTYASMKLLAQRLGVLAFDLLIAAPGEPAHLRRIAERLTSCADRFMGAAVGEWALADPNQDDDEPLPAALQRLAAAQLDDDLPGLAPPLPLPTRTPREAAAAHAN